MAELQLRTVGRGYRDGIDGDEAVAGGAAQLVHPKYRSDIDGLRAIAVLSVVGFHAFPLWFKGGFAGVDIFFVISGFLISTIILENLERGTFSFLDFYGRRIRRIFPALLLILVASFAFGWIALFADEYRQLGKHIAGGAGFVANFVLWNESGYFDNSAATKPLLHLWSLGIEEQFYILWPLLLWCGWRWRLNLLTLTVGIAAASFWLNVRSVHSEVVATFYSPQTRFWELMTGAILAYVSLHESNGAKRLADKFEVLLTAVIYAKSARTDRGVLRDFCSFLGMAFIVIGFASISQQRSFPGWWALFPTVGTALVIAAQSRAWLNRAVLSNRLLEWVGLISYPLYLWHWPLFSFAQIVQGEQPTPAVRVCLVAISIVLAWLTYEFIEKPIQRNDRGFAKAIVLLLAMLMAGCVGYFTYEQNGMGWRPFIEHTAKINAQFEGPLWRYTKNDNCLNRYPFAESADYQWWFCMASKDEKPTLLLLGHSYANHLYPGLLKTDGFSQHSILSIGTCEPDDRQPSYSETTTDPCSGIRQFHQQLFIDNIIATSGSLQYVIIDGLRGSPDSEYIAGIKRRIDFIERQNIKVIVFMPHLVLGYDIRNCFARPFQGRKRNCEVEPAARRQLNAQFQPLIDLLAKTNPQVQFFDQNDLFCDDKRCSMIKDGMPLFRDEAQHLSEFGSIELAKIFKNWAATNAVSLIR
jgi:peptidoglycan/LPS O-acetylase OafA/YrhL